MTILDDGSVTRRFLLDRGERTRSTVHLEWPTLVRLGVLPAFVREMNQGDDNTIAVVFDLGRHPFTTGIRRIDMPARGIGRLQDPSLTFELHGRSAHAVEQDGKLTLTNVKLEAYLTDDAIQQVACRTVEINPDGTIVISER